VGKIKMVKEKEQQNKKGKGNKKRVGTILLLSFLIFQISLVSAVEKAGSSFDLVYLFVENIFGNMIMAILGIGVIFIIMGIITQMSPFMLASVILIYAATMLSGLYGAPFAVIAFMGSLWYFLSGFWMWINAIR
jgi:hypothetical protein